MAYLQDISNLRQNLQSRDMGCVECMCVMTLLQEHVSCRHSDHHQVLPDLFFELTEWQQAGYKQKLKWTLECDRCDFKTTSKGKMFEHVATHQIIEETQNTIPLDDIPSPTLPTKRPRPSHSNHPSHPNQIPPKHRHLHPQPLPAHYSPILPHSNSHPLTHQRTHSGHTPNLPQLHRASYPAASAATCGAVAPAQASQKSTASAEAPAAAARRSMDSRVQEGTGDTISSAYDMVPLTDIQSATTSHNIRDHNIRDADSDNSMEGVIIKDEMSDSMDHSATVILHSDEVDINLAAESHRNSIGYAANDEMVLPNYDMAVPQIIPPVFKNGVPSGTLLQRHPGVCTLSDTISVLQKLPPKLLVRFARLSNNRDMLYIHSATANTYGIPLPRSTKLTTTTFPSYDPTNSSYTGAKRTNVHAYDIDYTTRMLLEALLTHPTSGTRRRMMVPQINKISVPHTTTYPSDTPPRGGPFITNRYNPEDHDSVQTSEPAQMTAKNNDHHQPPP